MIYGIKLAQTHITINLTLAALINCTLNSDYQIS